MGFYIQGKTQKSVLKRARKEAPKTKVVVKVQATRNKGQYYATTKTRKEYR